MTELHFGKESDGIAKLIAREMPAVSFVTWDLTPFRPYFHDWRKNIVFVECDTAAVDALAERLAADYPNRDIYAGVRKPVIKFNRAGKKGSIVVIARDGKKRREVAGNSPKIEKCLVDMLYYSVNGLLPMSLGDVLELWKLYLYQTHPDNSSFKPDIQFNELYRYSLRRYLGWLVSIMAYEMVHEQSWNSNVKGLDNRNVERGRKNLELVRLVEKFGGKN